MTTLATVETVEKRWGRGELDVLFMFCSLAIVAGVVAPVGR